MITISEILNNIDRYDEDKMVFVMREFPFNLSTKGFVGSIDNNEEYPLKAKEMKELFSVRQIKNILNMQSNKHKINNPTPMEKFDLLCDYIREINL